MLSIYWCLVGQSSAYSGNGDLIVHITQTGTRYHEAGCSYLKSDITVTLEEAYVDGYLPCERCNPPIYTGTAERANKRVRAENTYGNDSGRSDGARNSGYVSNKGNTDSSSNTGTAKYDMKTESTNKRIWVIVLFVIGVGTIIGVGIKVAKAIREENARIREAEEAKAKRKETYDSCYRDKTINELVDIPAEFAVTEKGEVSKGEITKSKPYGELTVFFSPTGNCYHSAQKCRAYTFGRKTDIYNARACGYIPCSFCEKGDKANIPEWYVKLRRIIEERDRLKKEFD